MLIASYWWIIGADIPEDVMWRASGASILISMAIMCTGYAFTYGLAGPVAALVSTQNLVTMSLNSLISSTLPSFLELLGMGLGISGATVITFGKEWGSKEHKY